MSCYIKGQHHHLWMLYINMFKNIIDRSNVSNRNSSQSSNQGSEGADYTRRVGPVNRVGPVYSDELFVARTWHPEPDLKFRRVKSAPYFFFKMASANVSKLFHQFGLVATLLLQHGLLYVYITYRHHVNKRLSIYYAVKRTIAQKFNPRCRANLAKSNCTRISNPLNRVVPVCSNRHPWKAGWPGCHVIKMLKNKRYIYEAG